MLVDGGTVQQTQDVDGPLACETGSELAHTANDVSHTFRVDSETARLLELITLAGFEQFHVDASDPAPALELPPPTGPDVPRLLEAIGPYGAEIVGPSLGPDD